MSGKPRCARCSSSSTARSSGSREARRGRFRAQRSPRWLRGGPRAEAQGPKTWQIECFPRTLWCQQFACTVIGDCSLWWDREKPTLFAQCLAPAEKRLLLFLYTAFVTSRSRSKIFRHKLSNIFVTKSIVLCYYSKMLQLRKYTLMI